MIACGHPKSARANARTLKRNHRQVPGIQQSGWMHFCPTCVAPHVDRAVPIVEHDVVHSSDDYQPSGSPARGTPLQFATNAGTSLRFMELRFTASALASALDAQFAPRGLLGSGLQVQELFNPALVPNFLGALRPNFADAEAMGRFVLAHPSTAHVDRFVQAVYHWGRGEKPYGKLLKVNPAGVAPAVLASAGRIGLDPAHVVLANLVSSVSHMGVSYGSKVLRMLDPQQFPVLDDVLEGGLGVGKNPAGYAFFCGELDRFLHHYGPMRAGQGLGRGTLEAGLFHMVDAYRA